MNRLRRALNKDFLSLPLSLACIFKGREMLKPLEDNEYMNPSHSDVGSCNKENPKYVFETLIKSKEILKRFFVEHEKKFFNVTEEFGIPADFQCLEGYIPDAIASLVDEIIKLRAEIGRISHVEDMGK